MKAGIYCRVSTLEQAQDGYSLIAQEEKLKSYANAMKYDIFASYIDDGYSGSSINRPRLLKMIEDIKLGKIDIVLIYKLDRLSRSVKNVLELVELFEKYNVKLFSLNENLDLSSPFGRASLKMSATFSELERETIVERMMMGKNQRVKQGKAMRNNILPIGYDYDYSSKTFVPNENEKEQVEKVFDLYLKGWNFSQISAFMHKNYKNRYGSYAQRNSVKHIIDNPFSAGYFWYQGTINKANNIVPIIPYSTWLKAQTRRLEAKQKRFIPTSPYLLTGLIFCGKCGQRYVSKRYEHTQTRKSDGHKTKYCRECYGCCARVKREVSYIPDKCDNIIMLQKDLDEIVIEKFKNLKFDKFIINAEDNAINLIQIQITDIENKIDKMLDLYENNLIRKEQLAERLEKLEKELNEKKRLFDIEKSKIEESPIIDIDAVKQKIKDFDNLSRVDQRILLKAIIKKITIFPDKIDIQWNVKKA